MRNWSRLGLTLLFAAAVHCSVTVMTTTTAQAQTYPSRLITLILPNNVGGAPDIGVRIFAEYLKGAWKHELRARQRRSQESRKKHN